MRHDMGEARATHYTTPVLFLLLNPHQIFPASLTRTRSLSHILSPQFPPHRIAALMSEMMGMAIAMPKIAIATLTATWAVRATTIDQWIVRKWPPEKNGACTGKSKLVNVKTLARLYTCETRIATALSICSVDRGSILLLTN